MKRLNKAIVRELLRYEPLTGELFWKRRARKWFKTERAYRIWNAQYPGRLAFTAVTANGYSEGNILSQVQLAHRIIWLWMTGRWPSLQIDHINHIRTDNRWINLREVSSIDQRKNTPLRRNNNSGQVGVTWFKRDQCWRAFITVDGRWTHLAYSSSFEEAVKIRKSAERKYDFHPNHGSAR